MGRWTAEQWVDGIQFISNLMVFNPSWHMHQKSVLKVGYHRTFCNWWGPVFSVQIGKCNTAVQLFNLEQQWEQIREPVWNDTVTASYCQLPLSFLSSLSSLSSFMPVACRQFLAVWPSSSTAQAWERNGLPSELEGSRCKSESAEAKRQVNIV